MNSREILLLLLIMSAVLGVRGVASQPRAEPAGSASRVALLIANAKYLDASAQLTHAIKDARTLAAELRRDGFTVDVKENLGKEPMRLAINEFQARIRPGAIALFYFSGFGLQVDRTNYLIPVNANIWSEKDVRREGTSIDALLAELQRRGAAVKLIILDASRQNPFERRFRELSAGLAAIGVPVGTLAISSAAIGKVVEDRAGETGLFMGELLKEMRAPGQTAEQAFTRTRIGVSRASNEEQVPWFSSSLVEDFYFSPPAGQTPPAAESQPEPRPNTAQRPEASPIASAAAAPKPGELFRDCPDCPEMVVVPAGDFEMGSGETPFEKPQHRITIAGPFAVERNEVTFAQWDLCSEAGACKHRPDDHGWGRGNRPVIEVSWDDTKLFVSWLSQKTGKKYRLPSEAEWEYAARGGTTSTYWWGSNAGKDHANCADCGGKFARQTAPTGSFRPNAFGLFDTAGNAAEWVEDCWNDSYRGAPHDGSAWTSGQCRLRVLRGGSFANKANAVGSAARFRYDEDVRYYANGFRVVRELQ